MIPLSDASRNPLRFPVVTLLIILANTVVFLLELATGGGPFEQWVLVPAQVLTGTNFLTVFTSVFIHAGWSQILINLVFFWAFGPETEDVMGPVRYLAFYLLGGILVNAIQAALDPTSTVAMMGASGAIAMVMGAFLITYPRDRIRSLFLFGWFVPVTLAPSAVLVALWFFGQALSDVGAIAILQTGVISYVARAAGLLLGALLSRFFEPPERRAAEGLGT